MRRRHSTLSQLALATAALGLSGDIPLSLPSREEVEPLPPKEKTEADLARIAKAEAKRARKAEKRRKLEGSK